MTTVTMSEETSDIQLRDYQIELLDEIERRRSCILFLPAGSGKTHIALTLIKSMAADLKKPFDEGGKRTFFLVNTVQLVQQQGALLSKLGNFSVCYLTGDSGVDSFRKDHWYTLQCKWEVFVMTTQIYYGALSASYLKLEDANLIIFDECHHATGNHPMAEVMKRVQECDETKKPKILGLSATLLKANIKSQIDFNKKLIDLESMYDGKIITSKKCKEIRERYSAKPTEQIKKFAKYEVSPETIRTLENLRDSGQCVLQIVKLKDNVVTENEEQNEIQLFKPGLNRSRLLQNTLKDILVHVTDYGLYVGYTCCQSYIVQLYRYMFVSCEPHYIDVILFTINLTQMMRKVLYTSIVNKIGSEDVVKIETIERTSCAKLKYLLDRLRLMKSDDRCIVFVEKKMTAKSLYKIVKIFVGEFPQSVVSVDFIVGSDSNPLRNTKEGFCDRRIQKQILNSFRTGKINVLIATDVLEEGIDVQECNLVIMFDHVKTFRSYVQSKGRARMKGGEYILLDDKPGDINSTIRMHNDTDRRLGEVMDRNDISAVNIDESPGDENETYETAAGAIETNVSAISKVYMYCATLPKDFFTDLIPYWWYNKKTKRCTVQLPSNAGIRTRIQGPQRSTWKEARQAAALETVKLLHQSGYLDDHLMPIRIPKEVLDTDYWFPNWDVDDNEKQEKAREEKSRPDSTFSSSIRIPKFLKDCRPLANTDCYLHVIHTKPVYETPKTQRHLYFHELMQFDEWKFGIITRKPLPPICEFPTYTDLGEVTVRIETNVEKLKLSREQLDAVSLFHRTLFLDVLRVVGKCFAFDNEGEDNGYFIVPLKPRKGSGGMKTELSWKCMRNRLEVDIRRPSAEEINGQQYTADNYVGKVVTPWYLNQPSTRFIVYDLSDEKNLKSAFNNDTKYKTFEEYFHKKYDLKPQRPEQPLLVVRPITANLDGICPKSLSVSQKRKRKEEDESTYLPPEYCHVYSFVSVYWYKSTIIPSVLHRFYYLLMAEELRQKIFDEAKVGCSEVPKSKSHFIREPRKLYAYCNVAFNMLEAHEDTTKHFKRTAKHESCPTVAKKPKLLGRLVFNQKAEKKGDNDEIKIKDIDRALDVNVEDIKQYAEYVESPLIPRPKIRRKADDEASLLLENVFEQQAPVEVCVNFVPSPTLFTLIERGDECGPQAHNILEAITLKTAGDVLNLERLETLGDSLLKYLASMSTFIKCADMNEGHLTILKGRLVSNRNLFYCGKKLDIASFVKAVNFSAKTFWCAPGFCVPSTLQHFFSGNSLSKFLEASIPDSERFSGIISDETINTISTTKFKKSDENVNDLEKRMNFYLGKHTLKRKDVSDVLEALIGLFLQFCGIKGAFKLLKYFGVLQHESLDELFGEIPASISSFPIATLNTLLPDYQSIEKLCNYRFTNKLLLLQAFTHPSYTKNVTDCYQKLEFIGDAILDFLITSYIYQYCGGLSPGQLTDLRSSLVNNNTFGALAVRLQLHRYLLRHSQRLEEAIERFVTYQQEQDYAIQGNELMVLINEEDAMVAEEVDVPKALGDVFESLAGAIFLDSGYNLTVVWNIYYNIMKKEIDEFSKRIPINPVRALHEKVPTKVKFCTIKSKSMVDNAMSTFTEKTKVTLKITVSKEVREYIGRGDNIRTAKRAAAKFALRELDCHEFFI